MQIRIILLSLFISTRLWASSAPSEGALIRDAEIEDVLKSFTTPLFEAAKLNPKALHLYIINSQEVNAFAMGGTQMAVYTGLLLKANSALQVMGVLAHETAHIAGGHIIRGMDAYRQALLQQLIGTIGGLAIGLANPEAGMGVLMGSEEIAKRGFLKFTRTQEGAADQGATRFLDSLGYSSQGLLEFMEILRKEDFFSEQNIDPYVVTHPLKAERIDYFKAHLSKSAHAHSPLPSELEDNFKRVQVKIAAFTLNPVKILQRFSPSDTSLLARYGRAIAYFQNAQIEEALKEINSLLKDFPKDAFFWDLKGQILFESGKIKEAALAYETAVGLRPDIPLLRVSWAHALIESGDRNQLEKAFTELLRARTEEKDNPFTYRLLAVYYGKTEKTGLAALSLAEMALEVGDLKTAEQQAKRSLHFLKADATNQLRAKEILEEVKRLKDEA